MKKPKKPKPKLKKSELKFKPNFEVVEKKGNIITKVKLNSISLMGRFQDSAIIDEK